MAAANERPASVAIELTLELDTKAEPIAGSLRGPDGTRYPFVGWLGLTAALETLRRKGPAAENAPGGSRGSAAAAGTFTAIDTDQVARDRSTREENS